MAEKRAKGELITDLKRVARKPALLFKLAAASLSKPDGAVSRSDGAPTSATGVGSRTTSAPSSCCGPVARRTC